MKKVLFATTALVMTAGVAAAEVAISGDGRMGMVYDGDDVTFSSRARVLFTLSGESDAGLSFGGEFRVDQENYSDGVRSAALGNAGHVWVSGAYGKLSMGNLNSASEHAVGDLAEIGYTGLGDYHEFAYLTSEESDDFGPSAVYEYSFDAFTAYASLYDGAGTITDGDVEYDWSAWSLGAKYSTDAFTVGLGYEKAEIGGSDADQWAISGEGTFNQFTVKAIYAAGEIDTVDVKQYGLSGVYSADALAVSAFYKRDEADGLDDADTFGIGAAYDLGGGATLAGGIVDSDHENDTIADIGVKFKF